MNPIEFCRQPGYHSTIFLTYSFDPLFFERLVLPTLRASGTGTTLVVADKNQLEIGEAAWTGQLAQLGKRYQLFGIQSSGSFHPKIIVRIGRSARAVWVGSANITFAGWSVNRELGAAWQFGPGQADSGFWLPALLAYLSENGVSGDYTFMDRVAREGWLRDLDGVRDEAIPSVLTTFGGQTLAAQLEERWSGRRFTSVRVLTGSTDTRGAWLNHLHQSFGVEDALVLADCGRCSFMAEELDRLPLVVTVSRSAVEGSNPLHAKFYWFDGPDGPAAIFGSANCSAAAWLVPQTSGGNHEAMVVYDAPDRTEFASILEHFDGELTPIDLAAGHQEDLVKPKPDTPSIRILNASWRDNASPLVIRFDKELSNTASVVATVSDSSVPLRPTDDPSVWISDTAPGKPGVDTVFVEVAVTQPESGQFKIRTWVNDYAELRQSEQGDDIDESLGNMGRARSTSEQREILKRLQQVSSAILEDSDLFADPQYLSAVRKKSASPQDEHISAPLLDPNDLVKSLGDIADAGHKKGIESTRSSAPLTLLGVMRALYEIGQEDLLQQESDYEGQWDDPETPKPDSRNSGGRPRQGSSATPERDGVEIDERFKDRLRKQTAEFLERLESREFADATSATQLIQAATYPLALSIISVRDKWASVDSAQDWCQRAFGTLFRQEYPGRCLGLIEYVAARYKENSQEDVFKQIVGDGTLWFALLSSIYRFSWAGPAGPIDRAFVLRDTYRNRHLIASADVGRLRTLISHDKQMRLREVLSHSPKIDDVLSRFENTLADRFDELLDQQRGRETEFSTSDLMWSKKGGWGVLSDTESPGPEYLAIYMHKRASERFVKHGFFVNATLAAKTDGSLKLCLSELAALAQNGGASEREERVG